MILYGSLDPPGLPQGRILRPNVRVAAAFAGMCSVAAVVLLATAAANRQTELFYSRFPQVSSAPTSQLLAWEGAGAGGSTGARYHWTSHSFSPVQGREVKMDFTHDHSTVANWFNRAAFEAGEPGPYWVKGAHLETYKNLTPSFNDLPEFNATWQPELIDPLEFWAQYFPIERGYSVNLFGEPAEEEPEEEAPANEEEAEETEPPPLPPHLFGKQNQMIFGDLEPMNFGTAEEPNLRYCKPTHTHTRTRARTHTYSHTTHTHTLDVSTCGEDVAARSTVLVLSTARAQRA